MRTDDTNIIDLTPAEPPRRPRPRVPVTGDVLPEFLEPPRSTDSSADAGQRPFESQPPELPRHQNRLKRTILFGALLIGMLCVSSVLAHYGYVLRNSLYDQFPMMRHTGDINNAFNQGTAVNDVARQLAANEGNPQETPSLSYLYRGWVKRIDDAYANGRERQRYGLDYVPLRLLIPTFWARNNRAEDATATEWREGYPFTAFMLNVNIFMAALTCVGMFLLIRHWVIRGASPGPGALSPFARARRAFSRWRGTLDESDITPHGRLSDHASTGLTLKAWALGWIGALLVWFEPNILVESHIWPQWDLWIVPFYVLAVWLASINRWFLAGLPLGVGVMLKGQLLFGAPLLLLWPLFDARPGAAGRLLVGFACAFLAVASPWLLQTANAVQYVGLITVVGLVVMACRLTDSKPAMAIASVLALPAIVLPIYYAPAPEAARPVGPVLIALALAALLIAVLWLGNRRSLPIAVLAIVCGAVVLCGLSFGGTWSWWHVGFQQGTHQYQAMYMGPSVNNLSAILHDTYRWQLQDEVFRFALPQPLHIGLLASNIRDGQLIVTIKLLMTIPFLIAMPLCAWGAARHARRNDPRFLMAITAPWVILFAFMPQMHERYLFWGAVIAVVGVGVSLGATLLWALVSAISVGMILHCQLPGHPDPYRIYPEWLDSTLQTTRSILVSSHPGLGYATMLLACVYLYLALAPSRRVRRPAAAPL
ncbi:MAG TPA: hypothetical protein VGN72_03400 [Tepidisphaeraceae bacterium]|nr:hypothetical protein [Tepidisphaeraceae bacterium]